MVRDWSKIFTLCVHNKIGDRDCMLAELVWDLQLSIYSILDDQV